MDPLPDPLLVVALGSGAGAAHGDLHGHRPQVVPLPVVAELLLEEHAALGDDVGVVVVALHRGPAGLDQDAAGAQALRRGVGRREVVLHVDESGEDRERERESVSGFSRRRSVTSRHSGHASHASVISSNIYFTPI